MLWNVAHILGIIFENVYTIEVAKAFEIHATAITELLGSNDFVDSTARRLHNFTWHLCVAVSTVTASGGWILEGSCDEQRQFKL
jgi:hypothetical protein